MKGSQFKYAIKFVADMDKAVKFYRDVLGLKVKFESRLERVRDGRNHPRAAPGFRQESSGQSRMCFTVSDVEAFYRDMSGKGVLFSMPPKKQDFGGVLAQFADSEGAHCSVGAQAA